MQQNSKKRLNILQIGLAVVFFIIALMVLAELIGWFKTETIFGIYWPVILIFLGIITMNPKATQGNGFAFGFVTLGILLLLHNVGVFNTQAGKVGLIVLLALCGIGVLAFATSKKPQSKPQDTNKDLYF